MTTLATEEFGLALGFNAENNPVCLIIMPESFYNHSIDVSLISAAEYKDHRMKLSYGNEELILNDISVACAEAIDLGCPLVVLNNSTRYESLIPISRPHDE